MAYRFLIKKLKPTQSPLLSTRWVLAGYDPNSLQEPSLRIHSYSHNHYDAVTAMVLLIDKWWPKCAACGERITDKYCTHHARLDVRVHGKDECLRNVRGEDIRMHTVKIVRTGPKES